MSARHRYTTGDVARTLHVTDEGVRHLVRDEQLDCVRSPSGLRIFQETEVLRLAEARSRARLRGVRVLRPHRISPRGEPKQMNLFSLRKVK